MRILAFAYACEPGEGSEPGAGWGWARMLAEMGDTWVITRENNRSKIEAAMSEMDQAASLNFSYVDLPARARFWKKGSRGVLPYYVLWQFAALRRARMLDRRVGFDLIWHLTFSTVWIGSVGALFDRPFVYGPVGGGVSVPVRLIPSLGTRGILAEGIRIFVRGLGRYLNPLARMSWRNARLILVQNPETRDWFPRSHRGKVVILPNVVLDITARPTDRTQDRVVKTALFAGRLLPWKGCSLAIDSMKHLPGWRLSIVGSGSDEQRLRRMVQRSGIEAQVHFMGRVPREEVLRMMHDADVMLFPSLREEAGWVIAEAASMSLPIVCLGLGGPPLLGGTGVSPTLSRGGTVKALASLAREIAPGPPGEWRFDHVSRLLHLERTLAESGLTQGAGSTRRSAGRSTDAGLDGID